MKDTTISSIDTSTIIYKVDLYHVLFTSWKCFDPTKQIYIRGSSCHHKDAKQSVSVSRPQEWPLQQFKFLTNAEVENR